MSLCVLAVDDSLTIRAMITSVLSKAGFEVHTAEDGCDGLEVLHNLEPDVIITDINMPNMDGFEFMESVRQGKTHRATPILVLTTESKPEMKARAKSVGASGWIIKPFNEAKLISALKRVAG